MNSFKDGDQVRIVNTASEDYGRIGHIFRGYKTHALVTFDGMIANFFEYSDIEPDDSAEINAAEPTSESNEPDMIQKPPHYNKFTFQPIDIIAEVTNYYEGSTAFHIGTVLKYLMRAPFKGNLLQDLQKAAYYLQRAIDEMEE